MRRKPTRARLLTGSGTALAAAAALALPLAAPTSARATPPGPGVTGELIHQSTVGDTDYIVRRVTVPPGQTTGWHYHDGPLHAVIKKGTLSHFDKTCASDGVYPTGSRAYEPPGPGNVHIGRNLGSGPLVLDVLYVLPRGAPLSQDAPNPGCSFE
ncbi:cupin domain-containing protein [Streptomyces flavofungini]|uniref:cupin domain-containing protein n=1 Tax=Streptomyces flavofungini TaxID=68200 RepID=UPI0025B14B6B|nr:cupin domain-containing protein [Streptomyces flavofungini]WJV48009.1 cupin domain-containing protein [Streptomyces flavofungini]